MIVGGATSAVELAEECARAGVPVVVAARSGVQLSPQHFLGRDLHDYAYLVFDQVPHWVVRSYCDRRPTLPGTDLGFARFQQSGNIAVRGPVARFEGKVAVMEGAETAERPGQESDAVVLAPGYSFAMPFLPPQVARARAGHPLADGGECRTWPGLYFVGTPCVRSLSSEFLRGIAKDAPHVVRGVEQRLTRR